MRKSYLATAVWLIVGSMALAQETPVPRVEVFTGFTVARVSFPISPSPGFPKGRATVKGWNASATMNANSWLGVVVEAGAQYGNETLVTTFKPPDCVLCTETFGATFHSVRTLLAGPQFSFREQRLTAFVHPLFGAGYVNEDNAFAGPPFSSTHFAFAFGGGLDFAFAKHFAVRGEPAYLMTRSLGQRQNNLRFSTGLVFRFGE